MPLPARLARFNKRFTNRAAMTIVRPIPGFGVVRHTGRTSGKPYRTPVAAFATDGGRIIALTYGAQCDWVRNVLAAGVCELETSDTAVEQLTTPRIVIDAANTWAPRPIRIVLRLLRVTEHLRMDIA